MEVQRGHFKRLINYGRFVVPFFQRHYSWKEQQWKELWQDIQKLYSLAEHDRTATHFLGALVYGLGRSNGPMAPTEFEVIDGQQRLITLSLLLAAIRDQDNVDENNKRGITEAFLVYPETGNVERLLRVKPGVRDLGVYEAIINGGSPDRGHLIYRAYRFFVDRLRAGMRTDNVADEDDTDAEDELAATSEQVPDHITHGIPSEGLLDPQRLLDVVLDRLLLVTISEVAPSDAYEVFRTINSSGLQLGQVDLLRNGVFMLMPKRARPVYDTIWQPMENLLGQNLETFFHAELLRLGHNIPKREIYRTQIVALQNKSEENIEQDLKRLADHAAIFNTLRYANLPEQLADRQLSGSVSKALTRLREWGSDPAFPLVLDAALQWRDSILSDEQFLYILEGIESLLVRRYICEIPPNDLRSSFATILSHIRQSESNTSAEVDANRYLDVLKRQLLEPQRRWSTDEDVHRACIERPFYRPNKQRYFGFILKRIAEEIEGKECPTITIGSTQQDFSVEHIMPQTLTTQWQRDMHSWGDQDQFRTQAEKVDVIGNLTLSAYNSELSDRPFADKRELLVAKSRLPRLNRSIIEAQRWSRAEIDRRSEELAKVIIDIWKRWDEP
jgi:uncharacterized protein with ParB-like and HNH nuclease domain